MSMLAYYAKRATTTKGLEHKATIENLRNYIKTTPQADLTKAINEIIKENQLRALWEAGLTAELQKAVLRRTEELQHRRQTT